MKGTVLITGGAGSVGKCVAQRLCDQGSKVRVFDLPQMDFSGLEDKEGIEIIQGDLTNAEAVEAGDSRCGRGDPSGRSYAAREREKPGRDLCRQC